MSAPSFPLLTLNRAASGAIERYRIVSTTATDGVVQQSSVPGDAHIGISGVARADDGDRIDIEYEGIVPVECGVDGIVPGDPLTSDADGRAVLATTGNRVIGTAMEAADTDVIFSARISPGTFAGA